ncbi:hypothetical protein [Micromonospora maritima]|uniref:hypothetical protein n=1 Tax=Micromonospora maritima TaxID=986711 RepID=UPI00157BB9DD|nr:hypothetical protein [Micromonospora maritima]
MNRRMVWAGCGQLAEVRIEAYSAVGGLLHGSLDASVYCCARHEPGATAAIHAAGLTAYRAGAPLHLSRTCGFVFRYPTARES